jgi:hypothetical protein
MSLNLVGCDDARDDPAGRAEVVEMVMAGTLGPGPGIDTLAVPERLRHVSTGGEVVGIRDRDAWIVVFFKFRGLNHYTGWIYSERELTEDPLGNRPFEATPLGPNWYSVTVG